MQEEDLYLVIQAGSEPGGPSNKATNPKRGRQKSEFVFRNSPESLATTHKTIWQRTSGSEGAEEGGANEGRGVRTR